MSLENHGGMISTEETFDSSLAVLSSESSSSRSGGTWQGIDEFSLRSIFVHTSKLFFLYVVKSYDTGPRALFPFRRKASYGFYRHWKSITWSGFEPRTLIPVTSTLTITPPRWRIDLLIDCKKKWDFSGLVLLKNSNKFFTNMCSGWNCSVECEILRKNDRLRVSENSLTRERVIGRWRKLKC
jgi:hypothetical protein